MKKKGTFFQWLFSVIFLIYGISMFTESIVTSIASILFGLSLCPFIWKYYSWNINFKKPLRIFLPILLFLITVCTTPSTSSSINSEVESAPNTVTEVFASTTSISTEMQKSNVDMPSSEAKKTALETEVHSTSDKQNDAPTDIITDASDLVVHFIDVGQGDSTLITCGDTAMLIDAADDSKGTAIQSYLQKQGIEKLNYLVLTHPDSDHIGGAPVIITKYDIGEVFISNYEKDNKTYQKLIQALDNKSLKYSTPEVGATYQLGNSSFTIIAPNKKYTNPNDASIGLILKNGNNKFLFTGDAEETAEEDILSNGIDLRSDVYQVGHHGSNTSSSPSLLDSMAPTYAVISCGEGNSYGHPRAETLNNFRAKGIKVFRTDEQGTIVATSDGNNITWNCSPSETWKSGEPIGSSSSTIKSTESSTTLLETSDTQKNEAKTINYVLNTKSKKFHLPSCNSLPTNNRKDTDMSREEIIGKGYSPCKKCNP